MKVYIIEANEPVDFFDERLDGAATKALLNAFDIKCMYRMALDKDNLEKALLEACRDRYDCIHLSCHGDTGGISIAGRQFITWNEFSIIFQNERNMPGTIVMAACKGGTIGMPRAFINKLNRPTIIFGSTESLSFEAYCTAWTILYTNLRFISVTKGKGKKVEVPSARRALWKICACVNKSFVYRRYDGKKARYVRYPPLGAQFEINRKV